MIRLVSQDRCTTSFMSPLIDLHSHSTISDGLLTPGELVKHATAKGVQVLALTDHDDTAGLAEAKAEAVRQGIQLIRGVEISVTWRNRTLHIVGLKIDPEYAPLAIGLAAIRAGRHQRAEGMAASLDKFGIENSLQGAYKFAGQSIIGRTHFARFLMEKGLAKDMRSVFKNYLVKGKPGYFEYRWAALEDALAWIIGSGGVAVIAHPGRYDLGRTNRLLLLEEFRNLGGAAIEVVTGSHTPDQYQEFARLAKQFGLQASMGSDYHGPGLSYREMGSLPDLPSNCIPVWQDWPEVAEMVSELH